MIKRYPFVHKMDNLWIDLIYKTVKYEINEQQEPILKFYSGESTAYVLNDMTLNKFNKIIRKRNNEVTNVTQSIQTLITESKHMKSEMIELNIKLDRHNEELDRQNKELKKMIQKMLSKNHDFIKLNSKIKYVKNKTKLRN